ncbi:MAG: hypothetical protein MHPSP_003402, partial [Paramarteilia canceri]
KNKVEKDSPLFKWINESDVFVDVNADSKRDLVMKNKTKILAKNNESTPPDNKIKSISNISPKK